jgi:hypothetical protein
MQMLFKSDVASSQRPLRITAPPAYSPYADAWKEFDRLNKSAHHQGFFGSLRFVFDSLVFGGAIFGTSIGRHHKGAVIAIWAILVGIQMASSISMKNRLKHWQCPRCHAEWPGTSKGKDPACKCGLRLHQLTP